jgi:hypothetical protein
MKQELNRILESSGYTEGLPDAWQFLHIDTIHGGGGFPAPMLSADEFHCVVPSGARYEDILGSVTARCSQEEQQIVLAGWGFPTPNIWDVENDPQILAGKARYEQNKRAPNRLLLLADSTKTLQKLKTSISMMQSPTAGAELASVGKALGVQRQGSDPRVIIVSSLAGGSGSAMFMDVAEILKRATSQSWANAAVSFLYAPEVFDSFGSKNVGLSRNALGAFNELIASRWVGLSAHTELLYQKMGLVASNTSWKTEFGCRENVLISAPQGPFAHTDLRDLGFSGDGVFLAVGQGLAAAVSNDEISDFMSQIALAPRGQWAFDTSGLAPQASNFQDLSMAATGIGFGKLSLGVEHIVDYVADAITKHQVKILLWPEFESPNKSNGVTAKQLIDEKTDQIWPNFILETGLKNETDSTQIFDALCPDDLNEKVKKFVIGIIQRNVSVAERPITSFVKAVWSDWDTISESFLSNLKNEVNSKAQNWVPEIQNQLQELMAKELTLNGYNVLSNLVERLEVELGENVLSKLSSKHAEIENTLTGFNLDSFQSRIGDISEGLDSVSTQNDVFLRKLSATLAKVVDLRIESHIAKLAAALVQEMLTLFFAPMRQQITESKFLLHQSQKGFSYLDDIGIRLADFPDWNSGAVPRRYQAGSLERVLIEPSEFESIYESYASQDSGIATPFQHSVTAALLGKKMNSKLEDVVGQTLIKAVSPWVTNIKEAQDSMGMAGAKVDWKFHTGLAEMSEINRHWLRDGNTSFGKFLKTSIREYVSAIDDKPQTQNSREIKFISEFENLLRIARPLVSLNGNAMKYILGAHDGSPAIGVLLSTSKIPFDFNSRVGQACTQILMQHGHNPNDPGFAQRWFYSNSSDRSIIAMSTTISSLPAWAFASMTEPILKHEAESKNQPEKWRELWHGRRARPLVEAVPFETEMRRSIITGWFIATLFGMRKVESVPAGRTAKIWNPTLEKPDWSTFPSPLLNSHPEDMKHDSWLLPQLLISAGIALANFGKTGNPEFINGYRLLKYLGREVTTCFKNRDQWDGRGLGDLLPSGERSQSSYLRNWVKLGDMPSESHSLQPFLQNALIDNPDRGEALITAIEKLRAQYSELWKNFSDTPWHSLPETWELKDDIDLALEDMANYVSNLGHYA